MKNNNDNWIILSIPHTGSHFTHRLTGLEFFHLHNRSIWREYLSHRIIVPLRHPKEIVASYKRRSWPIGDAIECLVNLLELDKFCPFYFPIDHPDKTLFLSRLQRMMKRTLVTDWKPEEQWFPQEIEWTKQEDENLDYMWRIGGSIFSRYY